MLFVSTIILVLAAYNGLTIPVWLWIFYGIGTACGLIVAGDRYNKRRKSS